TSPGKNVYVNQPTRPQQGSGGSTALSALLIILGLLAIGFFATASDFHIALSQWSQGALVVFGIALLVLSTVLMFTRLYHKVPADIALVRTGMGGKKTVLDGG